MARFPISPTALLRSLRDLLETPSPTGYTDWAVAYVEQELADLGIPSFRTKKGALVGTLAGLRDDRPRALTAHVDTLGAVVAEIKANGRLRLSPLGGVLWPTVESEGVTIHCRNGRQLRGSIVFVNGSAHVNRKAATAERNEESLEVRIDERTSSQEETIVLGVEVGDFVSFDPRVEVSESGFVRSRFLDDKAGVACLLAACRALVEAGVTPGRSTTLIFNGHEEAGHVSDEGIPPDLHELVVVDMACVGEGQNGSEFTCSLCVKDASGPYSRNLTDKLRMRAEEAGVDLRLDVYPFYRSDGSAYWRNGGAAEVALIGPGIDTSHGYERTHTDALIATAEVLAEYLVGD